MHTSPMREPELLNRDFMIPKLCGKLLRNTMCMHLKFKTMLLSWILFLIRLQNLSFSSRHIWVLELTLSQLPSGGKRLLTTGQLMLFMRNSKRRFLICLKIWQESSEKMNNPSSHSWLLLKIRDIRVWC